MRDGVPFERNNVTMTQLHNGDHEYVVLRRFPFHECLTRQAMMNMYGNAVRYMLQIVPEDKQLAVMGRFSRKLIKHYNKLKEEGR